MTKKKIKNKQIYAFLYILGYIALPVGSIFKGKDIQV